MTNDIPSTDVIRHWVAWGLPDGVDVELDHDFERVRLFEAWLRGVKAEAWSAGALWALAEAGVIADENADWLAPGDNPYREGENK
jgi:hypothetical protein